jgi:phage-related tail protein
MDDPNKVKNLKWVIGLALAGGIGFYALPILASMALNMVTIALCGLFFMSLWFFLPAISEAMAQLSYRMWEMAIRVDPIAKLKRELRNHADQIANTEKRIAESNAQVMQLDNLLKEHRGTLSPEELADWSNQISMLKGAGIEMINLRNQSLKDHETFQREVQKAEAQYKIGQAFKSALGAFTFNQKSGKEAEGARVAINEVQKQLAESQSKLNVILSRKTPMTLPAFGSGEYVPAVQVVQLQPVRH